MKFIHPPEDTDGPPPTRLLWFEEAVADCGYDFNQVPTAVTIAYSPDPVDADFAVTEVSGNSATVVFKDDLYDPDRPGDEGGAAAGTYAGKAFFQEVVIHELAHVVIGAFFSEAWQAEICELFGREADDWSPPDAPWRHRVVEATAETFKDVFTNSDRRKFLNRTDFILPERNFHDFVKYFTIQNPIPDPDPDGPQGPHAGLLSVPQPQVFRTEFAVDWSGLVVVTTTTKIPELVDGEGVVHAAYDVVETHSEGGAGVNEPILLESYPAYISHPPPPPLGVLHPATVASPGLGRPRNGDEDAPGPPSQEQPKVSAEIGNPDDVGTGMAVTVGFGLPGHVNRHGLTGIAEDGLPQGFVCQYPENLFDEIENPDPEGPPDDLQIGPQGASPFRSWVPYVTPMAPVQMEEGDQSPYPDTTDYRYRFTFVWPTAREGGGTSVTGSDPPAVKWGWIYPPSSPEIYGPPDHDPDAIRGRGTVQGDWLQEMFVNIPFYPYEFPILPDLHFGTPGRGNVRYEAGASVGTAANKVRTQRKVSGRELRRTRLG